MPEKVKRKRLLKPVQALLAVGLVGLLVANLAILSRVAPVNDMVGVLFEGQWSLGPQGQNRLARAEVADDGASQDGQVMGVTEEGFFTADSLAFRLPTNFEEVLSANILQVNEELSIAGQVILEGPITLANDVTATGGVDIDLGDGTITASNVVYSVGGESGELELVAGDGVTVDGLTISSNDLGSDQEIFKNIEVGSDTISADSNDDTLEFSAGSGVNLSSSGSTITFSSNNLSGWHKPSSEVVSLITSSNKVGIGTANPSAKLEIDSGSADTAGIIFSKLTSGSPVGVGGGKVLSVDSGGEVILVNDQTADTAEEILPTADEGSTLFFNGANWVSTTNLYHNDGEVGISTTNPAGRLHVNTNSASVIGAIFQAESSQTANLTEWRNSAGSVLSYIDSDGVFNGSANVDGTLDPGLTQGQVAFQGADGLAGSNNLFWDNDTGRLGIGTTSPGSTLQIGSAGSGTISVPGSGSESEQFGFGASATADDSIAIGYNASVPDPQFDSIAIGHNASIAGRDSIAIGDGASAQLAGIAVGNSAANTNWESIALGYASSAGGQGSIVLGTRASAGASGAIAIGTDATTTSSNQLVIGSNSNPIVEGYIGNGVTNSSPSNLTLNATGGSGTDIDGANLSLAGGKGTGAGVGGNIFFKTSPAGSSGSSLNSLVNRMIITDDGQVGIGTTEPARKLEIHGLAGTNHQQPVRIYDTTALAADVGGGINLGGVYTGSSVTEFATIGTGKDNDTDGEFGGYLWFGTRTDGTSIAERVRIDSSGNVGIGTTNPSASLDIAGGTLNSIDGTDDLLVAGDAEVNGTIYQGGTTVCLSDGTSCSASAGGWTDDGTVVRLTTSTDQVGIGTTNPTAELDIAGSASSSGTLSFRGTTDPKINILNGEDFGIQTSVGGDAGLTERLTITNEGFTGIGTTAPSHFIDVEHTYNETSGTVMGTEQDIVSTGGGSSTLITAGFWGYNQTATTGNIFGIYGDIDVSADVSDAYGVTANSTIRNGATVPTVKNVRSRLQVQNAGTTITDLSGVYVENAYSAGTITNMYGLYIEDMGTATNEFGVYAAGADDDNYFAGNVGIGTTAPETKLDLSATLQIRNDGTETSFQSASYPRLYNSSTGGSYPFTINGNLVIQPRTNTQADIIFATDNGTSIDSRVVIKDSGNVGIGTTGPATALDIDFSDSTLYSPTAIPNQGFRLINSDTSGGGDGRFASLRLLAKNSTSTLVGAISVTSNTAGNGTAMTFQTRNDDGTYSERMRIAEGGDVGIGTTAPDSDLVIGDNSSAVKLTLAGPQATKPSSEIEFEDSASGVGMSIRYDSSDNLMSFYSNNDNAPRMIIERTGDVGIGTIDPGNKLHIVENAGKPAALINNQGNGSGREGLHIYAGENIDPTTDFLEFRSGNNSQVVGSVTGDGAGGVNFNGSSDRRLKTNIQTINSALEGVKKLNPITYTGKLGGGEEVQHGFIAQEVAEVYPELANEPKTEKEYWTLSYARFTPILTRAIQEQQQQILGLNTQVSTLSLAGEPDSSTLRLNDKLEGLEERVAALEASSSATTESQLESGLVDTVLSFLEQVSFKAKAVFEGNVEFLANVVFQGKLTVNQDTAGKVVVPAGANSVKVTFSSPFITAPVVYLSSNANLQTGYNLKEVTTSYFVLQLAEAQSQDVAFNWLAVMQAEGSSTQVEVLEDVELNSDPTPEPISEPTVAGSNSEEQQSSSTATSSADATEGEDTTSSEKAPNQATDSADSIE